MIARTSFLPRLFVTLGLAGASSVVAACGGHIVSLGNTGDTSDKLSSIPPATATASINNSSGSASGACPAGYAHPNICCDAAAGVASTCGEWTVDPFRACSSQGPSWTTYPNAFQCCSLSDPTDCMSTPADAGAAVPPPPPPIGCGFVCPPGWWSPPNDIVPVASSSSSSSGGATSTPTDPTSGGAAGSSSSGSTGSGSTSGSTGSGSSGSTIGYGGGGGSCCTMLGDGSTYCDGWGYAEPVATSCGVSESGSSSGSSGVNPGGPILFEDGGSAAEDAGSACVCSCPANEPDCACDCTEDAGPPECGEDAGSPYPPGYDGGVTSLCGACPPGWLADSADPLLCCQTLADDVEECFSQATGSATGFSSGSSGGSSVNGGSANGSGSSSSSGGTVVSPPVSYPTDAGITSNGGN